MIKYAAFLLKKSGWYQEKFEEFLITGGAVCLALRLIKSPATPIIGGGGGGAPQSRRRTRTTYE
jgi:hypothetical protein